MVPIILKKTSFTSIRFLVVVAFCALFMGVFGVGSSPAKAQTGLEVPYARDDKGKIKDRDCGSFFDKSLSSSDVKCRCPINSCRLSNEQGKYSCILGSVEMKYYLGYDSEFIDYTDVAGYVTLFGLNSSEANKARRLEEIGEEDLGIGKSGVLEFLGSKADNATIELIRRSQYTDIFNANGAQAMIPAGSYCRLHPNDPNGVAYWYYPGYFYTLQGRDYFGELQSRGVAGIGNVAVGAACGGPGASERVLFTDRDLFGNPVTGTKTFFGCLPNSTNGITAFLVRLITGLAIFVTLIIAGINLILIIGNPTNPDLVQQAQKKMFAAITTLIGILLTITILNIVGIQIIGFGSDGIGGSVFRFFVGGN